MHRFSEPYYIYLIPILFGIMVSLRAFSQKWPTPYRILSILLLVTLLIELCAIFWMWDWWYRVDWWHYKDNNTWIYNAGLLIRLVLFLWLYHSILTSVKVRRLVRQIGGLALLLLVGIYILRPLQPATAYFLVFNPVLILLAVLYFRQLLQDDKVIRLQSDPFVWVSVGVFFYHAATLPFYIIINSYVHHDLTQALSAMHYNDVFNILMYTLFLIAFLCKPQPKPLPSSSSSPPY